jgi:hypothetical protein
MKEELNRDIKILFKNQIEILEMKNINNPKKKSQLKALLIE